MRRLGTIIFSRSSQRSWSFLTLRNDSVVTACLKVKCDSGFNFPVLFRISSKKSDFFSLWKRTLSGVNHILEVREGSPWRPNAAAAFGADTPLSGGSVMALVMSLAALTQVICMRADSGGDVQQRQWCTYHFPQWLIEDCNLCRTFSLITRVSGSKTRTLSCHWALDSSRAFSLQEEWSPPLRWAQFLSHLYYC